MLRSADAVAQRYGCRPSQLLGVQDPYAAYCIDEAAALVGVYSAPTDPDTEAPPRAGKRAGDASLDVKGGVPSLSGRVEMIRKSR